MFSRATKYIGIGILGAAILSLNSQALAADFAARSPTEDEIIQALDPPKMRGIRPGAAAKTMARPSISMELQFDFNSAKVSESEAMRLSTVAKSLNNERLSTKAFEVIGHTDAKGSVEYNQKLSERRANAVIAFLINQGVDRNRLKAVGKGKSDLKNKADPEAAENRRVEIAVGNR